MKKVIALSILCMFANCAVENVYAKQRNFQSRMVECGTLTGFTVSAKEIGPTTGGAKIDSAEVVAAEGAMPAFCKVTGAILSSRNGWPIRFRVWLPDHWNGKAVHLGGSGYDGAIPDGPRYIPNDVHPLIQGYAMFGSDSGHDGGKGRAASRSGSFAMDEEALENYAGIQIKKTHDAALSVIQKRYGARPIRTYFQGASQGGHEALIAIQRWPDDYAGAVAIHPAFNWVALQLGGLALSKTLYASSESWLSPEKLKTLSSSVLAACDVLDGVADGIISNVTGCRAAFVVESLRCPDGKDTGSTCLSDAQLDVVRKIDSEMAFGFALEEGVDGFGRWPLVEGAFTGQIYYGFGDRPIPAAPPEMNDAFSFGLADPTIRYIVTKNPAQDSLRFEPKQHISQLQQAAAILNTGSTDLSAFKRRGGKLLIMHGTIDMAVPPSNSIAYFNRLKQRYGANLSGFVRFYMLPGFGHGDGSFVAGWDSLSTLDKWVSGTAPGAQTVQDVSQTGAGRTRPLCEYPNWPRYNGEGDQNLAKSYICLH